jgi:hypothetical protein
MSRAFRFDLRTERLSETTAVPSDASLLWTSKPYPLEVIENLATGHEFVGGFLWQHLDSLDSTHAFVSGQLRSPLQYASIPAESLDSTHAFTAGELRVVLKTYSAWAPESLDSTHAFTSGILKRVLITYDQWPAEALDSTHAFVSGTLT